MGVRPNKKNLCASYMQGFWSGLEGGPGGELPLHNNSPWEKIIWGLIAGKILGVFAPHT